MCKGLTRQGFCYLIAGLTYLAGVLEIVRNFFLRGARNKDLAIASLIAWALILIVGIFLLVGTCLSDSHRRSKSVLLKIWIIGAVVFGFAVACIKVTIIIILWQDNEIQRNLLHATAFCFYLALLFFMVYFPCQYQLELDDEIDY